MKYNIHKYLQNKKIRGWLLFPPLLLLIITSLIIYYNVVIIELKPNLFYLPIMIFLSIYFIVGVLILFWSDITNINSKFKNHE